MKTQTMNEVGNAHLEIKKMANNLLRLICSTVGCDIPRNADDIITFIVNDVVETADPDNWHSGDIAIAFRRWMERDLES